MRRIELRVAYGMFSLTIAFVAVGVMGACAATPSDVMAEQCVRAGGSYEMPSNNARYLACVVHHDTIIPLPRPDGTVVASPTPAEDTTRHAPPPSSAAIVP